MPLKLYNHFPRLDVLNNFGQKGIRTGCSSGELAVIVSKGLDHQARSDVHGIYFLFRDGYRPSSEDIYRFISQNRGISISLDMIPDFNAIISCLVNCSQNIASEGCSPRLACGAWAFRISEPTVFYCQLTKKRPFRSQCRCIVGRIAITTRWLLNGSDALRRHGRGND